jgi:S1-C subfamily serine protease
VLGLPISALRAIVETLETRGTIARGFLGITTHPVRLATQQATAAGQPQGLVVVGVAQDSPASAALLVGDVIVAAGGGPVSSAEDLVGALGPETVGRPLVLRVVRGAAASDVSVTVGSRPARG